MNEEHIRALVREALARHLDVGVDADGRARRAGPTGLNPATEGRAGCPNPASPPASYLKSTLAFGRFVSLAPTDPDAPCVVEPQVKCHHCGFCQSYGH